MDFPDSGSKLNSLWRIHSRFMKGWWCRTKSIRSAPPPLSIQSHERRVVLTSCLRSDTPMTAKRALAHPSESAVRRFLAGQDVLRPVRHCGIPLGRAEHASMGFLPTRVLFLLLFLLLFLMPLLVPVGFNHGRGAIVGISVRKAFYVIFAVISHATNKYVVTVLVQPCRPQPVKSFIPWLIDCDKIRDDTGLVLVNGKDAHGCRY